MGLDQRRGPETGPVRPERRGPARRLLKRSPPPATAGGGLMIWKTHLPLPMGAPRAAVPPVLPSDLVPPTCLSLWERWQAERPDGEGGHAILLDQRFLNAERRYPLSHGPSGSVPARCGAPGRGSDGPPDRHSLPRLRFAHPQRESQVSWRKAGALYYVPTFCLPTCLPLWGRWQAKRPDGEGGHAILLDQRFLNAARRYPLRHRPFGPVTALPLGEPSGAAEDRGVWMVTG